MKRIVLLLVAAITMSLSLSAQNRTVRGIVFGVYNGTDPLVGATVMGVGTNIGVTTDINGVFDITLPESVKKILVSYVGMKPQEFDITPDKEMVVTLQSDTSLDEVVVTAFGMKRDRKGLGCRAGPQGRGPQHLRYHIALERDAGQAFGRRDTSLVGCSRRVEQHHYTRCPLILGQ